MGRLLTAPADDGLAVADPENSNQIRNEDKFGPQLDVPLCSTNSVYPFLLRSPVASPDWVKVRLNAGSIGHPADGLPLSVSDDPGMESAGRHQEPKPRGEGLDFTDSLIPTFSRREQVPGY